jgi:hypothetical protein
MTRFCQKVYDESDHFTTPDPVEVCKSHIYYEVVRSFFLRAELSEIEFYNAVIPLHLC